MVQGVRIKKELSIKNGNVDVCGESSKYAYRINLEHHNQVNTKRPGNIPNVEMLLWEAGTSMV